MHAKLLWEARNRTAAVLEEAESLKTDIRPLFLRLLTFASEWLSHHIVEEDKKCEPFFKKGNELPLGLLGDSEMI